MEAMLRSWAEADISSAWLITGNSWRTPGCAASSDIRTSDPTRSRDGCRSIPRYGRALMSTTASGRSTVSRIKSTSEVPPAIYRAPDAAEASADASSWALVKLNGIMVLRAPCRAGDRGDDVGVGAAAANVAAHPFPDLRGRSGVALLNAPQAGHDLAGGTRAALKRVLVDEGLLQPM